MTELKRWDIEYTGHAYSEYRDMVEEPDGEYVLFTDYSAKCADYERLREALEKIAEEWQALNAALIKYQALTVAATTFAGQEIRDMRDAVRRGREALTPAAASATTSSDIVAARKAEESD